MIRKATTAQPETGEEGYLLVGLVVVCFLMVLALGIAAPRVAKQLERDREVESEHRAQEYVRAIQLYYRKNNRYPTSVEELLGQAAGSGGISLGGGSTNLRYLRQQYKDPLTGGEYKLIHFGEAKTEVKGFFGEALQGIAAGNLGAAASMQSNLGSSTPGTSGAGSATQGGAAAASSTLGLGAATGTAGTPTSGTASPSAPSSTSATTFQGSKGAIVGVGSGAKGPGLVEWNGSANIEDWEFLYDPRVDQLKSKVSILGGGPPTTSGGGSLGSGFTPAGGAGIGGSSTTSTGGFGSTSSPAPTSGSGTPLPPTQ